MIIFEKTAYAGWQNCYRLSNGQIEMVVTADIGPRIIHFGLLHGENELRVIAEDAGQTGGESFRFYGGHRLWIAPEDARRTYMPDNRPVQVLTDEEDTIRFVPPAEEAAGIQKEIAVCMDPDRSLVHVRHRVTNTGMWAVNFAPWALTVMASGGMAIVPLPPRGAHPKDLLPTSSMVLWAYTDLSDPRWVFGREFVCLKQDPAAATPQKVGMLHPDGWAGYFRKGNLFLKRFPYQPGAVYPDMGCNFETFTDAGMLELESLGALQTLEPGQTVEHCETWGLFGNVAALDSEAAIRAHVLPLVKELE